MTYEAAIHERVWTIFQAYKTPEVMMLHVPNGERRGPRTAAKLARMGVIPGVPDFECIGGTPHVFFLELKRPQGRLSKDQVEFIRVAALHDVPTFVAWSVEAAVELLQKHGVLRADISFTVTRRSYSDLGAQDGSEVSASDPSNKFTKEAAIAG